ncbi:hypothetical protein LP419_10670 [Massilia sp. H-1]|nr:hypothetical protein LP419_10670 [Massilia sp. H-1]
MRHPGREHRRGQRRDRDHHHPVPRKQRSDPDLGAHLRALDRPAARLRHPGALRAARQGARLRDRRRRRDRA